jgi:hypothetical protein
LICESLPLTLPASSRLQRYPASGFGNKDAAHGAYQRALAKAGAFPDVPSPPDAPDHLVEVRHTSSLIDAPFALAAFRHVRDNIQGVRTQRRPRRRRGILYEPR